MVFQGFYFLGGKKVRATGTFWLSLGLYHLAYQTGFDLVWTTNVLRHVEFLRRLFGLPPQQKYNKQQPSSTMAAAGVAGPYGASRRPMPAYDSFADSPRPHDPRSRRKSGGGGVEVAQTAARVGDACGRRRRSHDMHNRGRRK